VDLPNNSTDAVMTRAGGGAWDSDYQVGSVLLWDNELLKIIARNGAGTQITVERGFGDSSPAAHLDGNDTDNDVARWVRGAPETDSNDTVNWNLQADAQDCNAHIIVKKVVTGTGSNPDQGFTADIDHVGTGTGDSNDRPFSQNTPNNYSVNQPSSDSGDDNFNVTEDTPPANYKLTGKFTSSGDVACPSATSSSWTAVTGTAASDRTAGLTGVDNGETWTVCFRNATLDSITVSQGECVVGAAPAFSFHFIAPNTDAGSGGSITVGYKIDGGSTQFTAPVAENGSGAKANWHVSIPFGRATRLRS
jgi:hypothetical protein